MAGATTFNDALCLEPNTLKVSNIPTTVPNNPIKGEVEAIIDSSVKPLVELRIASLDAASNMALFGKCTRLRYVYIREFFDTVDDLPRYKSLREAYSIPILAFKI